MAKYLATFCLLTVISVIVLLRQSSFIVLEEVTIEISGLPPAFDGLRIAQLTDLHGRDVPKHSTAMQGLIDFSPDIIVLTGDYVSTSIRDAYRLEAMLHLLPQLAPTFAVSGNHDHHVGWPSIAEVLQKNGIMVLDNSHVSLNRGDESIVIAGVQDPATGHDRLQEALPSQGDAPIILLAHAPTWFQMNRFTTLTAVSLVLSGHTHGGQIKLPLIGAVTNASGRLFPRSFVEGLSVHNGTHLYISRGIGYTGIPFRFLARPEITLITLHTPSITNEEEN